MGKASANKLADHLCTQLDGKAEAKLMAIMDRINAVHGDGTVHVAGHGIGREWRAKLQTKTPAYTTRRDELPKARTL